MIRAAIRSIRSFFDGFDNLIPALIPQAPREKHAHLSGIIGVSQSPLLTAALSSTVAGVSRLGDCGKAATEALILQRLHGARAAVRVEHKFYNAVTVAQLAQVVLNLRTGTTRPPTAPSSPQPRYAASATHSPPPPPWRPRIGTIHANNHTRPSG